VAWQNPVPATILVSVNYSSGSQAASRTVLRKAKEIIDASDHFCGKFRPDVSRAMCCGDLSRRKKRARLIVSRPGISGIFLTSDDLLGPQMPLQRRSGIVVLSGVEVAGGVVALFMERHKLAKV
jgi:hypothetical protein